MKIEQFTPPPPQLFTMTFNCDDGWAIVMALRDAYAKYEGAVGREDWKKWASELDQKLRA